MGCYQGSYAYLGHFKSGKRDNMKTVKFLTTFLLAMVSMIVIAGSQESTPILVPGQPAAATTVIPQQLVPLPATTDTSAQAVEEETPKPFGANLFETAASTAEREDGLNPDYIIQPGDRITVRIWGATKVDEISVVDAQGNIFIPGVGPIKVQGVKNSEINQRISQSLKKVFTENINVYTNLESTTPVLVFVTGFVNRPGSYAGVASDSLLYFLERAGGIDLERGSFRDVEVLRNGKQIASLDLYDFILDGKLPRPQFADGDTIVVGKRGASIIADGAVRNSFSFEIPPEGITGNDLIALARPLPDAHYTTVIGTRNNKPFSTYVPLEDFEKYKIKDGDHITFQVDQVHGTILVNVEGNHIGQSHFVVPRDTTLLTLLDYIKVDPVLSDINAISIKRQSLKIRQKQAIEDSLDRLESAVYSQHAVTTQGAAIRAQEAQMITQFVEKARQVEPQGVLVVARQGKIANVLLQPDDVINIPDKTNIVQVSGEVMVPQALVYEPGDDIEDYISRVGGYSDRADDSKHMIIRRSGEVIPLMGRSQKADIKPGDEIIALPEVPSNNVEIAQVLFDTIFKVASSSAVFLRLSN